MYSSVIRGKVCDWKYKRSQKYIYKFYIDEYYIGQVFKMKRRRWSAVFAHPNNVCPVNGFSSRSDASEFLLKLWRIKENNDMKINDRVRVSNADASGMYGHLHIDKEGLVVGFERYIDYRKAIVLLDGAHRRAFHTKDLTIIGGTDG